MARNSFMAGILGSSSIAMICLASCGPEPPPAGEGGGEGGGTSSAGPSTGDSESPTEPTTSGTGTGTGGDVPPAIPEACALVLVPGEARIALDSTVIGSTRLTVLDPGAPGVPPRVMATQLEALGPAHSNLRARNIVVDAWPTGVAQTAGPLWLTRNGHSISRFVELDGSPRRFAYVWTGDPRGLNSFDTFFSVLDADAWTVGGEVELGRNTNSLFVDLQRTGSPSQLIATLTSESYDTVPDGQTPGFSLAVLDGAGKQFVGPTPLNERAPDPGTEMRTFWAGDRVAAAMSHNGCLPEDDLCVPHSVVLARPDEDGAAVDGFAFVQVIDGLVGTKHVSRPQVSPLFDMNWLTWYEGDDWVSSDEHRTFRGMVLDADGSPLAWPPADPAPGPISFLKDTSMASWPNVLVSEFGITVAYRTADNVFEVHHHDFAFKPIGEPILLALDSQPHYPAMVALAEPRSLLLAWVEDVDLDFSLRMVRLECG